MEPSIDELRRNYESFDDNKLIRIATREASSLRPEALDLLQQIIKERKLSNNISAAIDVQFGIDEEQLIEYCDIIRKQPCPVCGTFSYRLNAAIVSKTVSFIVMSSYTSELIIACPDCLDRRNDKDTLITMLLGWWEPFKGIYHSLKTISSNNKIKKEHHSKEPSEWLKAFVLQNIGSIELNRKNSEELQWLIRAK